MKKGIITIILAILLSVSLIVPAFATGEYHIPTGIVENTLLAGVPPARITLTASTTLTVNPTLSTVYIDGVAISFEAYLIHDENYFKLRDVAFVLNGTEKTFSVGWNTITGAATLIKGQPYTPDGSELIPGDGLVKTAMLNTGFNVTLDGIPVEIRAYLIDDYNFIRMRDIINLFELGWSYDEATRDIRLYTQEPNELPDDPDDSDDPDELEMGPDENPELHLRRDQPTQPDLSAETLYNKMIALKTEYPEGMRWTNADYYGWSAGVFSGGYGCAAFAFILSDAAFGDLPARRHTDLTNIRVGDILRMNNDTHSVIVLSIDSTNIVIAEGNYNSSIRWERTIPISHMLTNTNYVITRYPE